MQHIIEELEKRRAQAKLGGGEKRIANQHAKGKLTARERVDLTISNVYLAAYQLGTSATEAAGKVVQLQPPVETVTSYIAFAKGKHADALADFDANIDKVLKGDKGNPPSLGGWHFFAHR